MLPVLNAGFRAPLVAGFREFLRAPRIEQSVEDALAEALAGGKTDPYESHPPLRDRIQAVADLLTGSSPPSSEPSLSLLGDTGAGDEALFGFLARAVDHSRFRAIDWPDVPEQVLLPSWREHASKVAPILERATFAQLLTLLRQRRLEIARFIVGGPETPIQTAMLPEILSAPLGSCLVSTLVAQGWSLAAGLGEPVTVARDGTTLEPFAVIGALLLEDRDAELRWASLVQEHGLGELPLVLPAPA